jgi:hypothetical protein
VAGKQLEHGRLEGMKCPHCEAVCQPLCPGSSTYGTTDDNAQGVPLEGLAAHMLVVHPDRYEQWAHAKRW